MTATQAQALKALAAGDAAARPHQGRTRGTYHTDDPTPRTTPGEPTAIALAAAHALTRHRDPIQAIQEALGHRPTPNAILAAAIPLAYNDTDPATVAAITRTLAPQATHALARLTRYARRLIHGRTPQEATGSARRLHRITTTPEHAIATTTPDDTQTAAIWCLLTTDTTTACTIKALNLGDDTQTTTALATALAAIAHGPTPTPTAWDETTGIDRRTADALATA